MVNELANNRTMVVFICNYERTYSFIDISNRLKLDGIEVELWVHDDLALKIASSMKVAVKDLRKKRKNRRSINIASDLSSQIDLFLVNDRFLSTKRSSREWLLNVFFATSQFIKNNRKKGKITFYGEVSWAVEAVTALACEQNNIDYLLPVDTRFLDQRFILVNSRTELPVKIIKANIPDVKARFVGRPGYTALELNRIVSRRLGIQRVKNIFRVIKSRKYLKLLIAKLLAIICDKFFYKLQHLSKGTVLSFICDRNVVVFPLHIQPEASVDYLAPDCIDQFTLINDLLKNRLCVLVKDHPARINELYFTDKIKTLFNNNVYICPPDIDILDYENVKIFVTITGTLAGQAALKGKLGITLKEVFFNIHPNCRYVPRAKISEYVHEAFKTFMIDPESLKSMNEEFLCQLDCLSTPGRSYGFLPEELDPIFQDNFYKIIFKNVNNR
jgi:hypothetical protein